MVFVGWMVCLPLRVSGMLSGLFRIGEGGREICTCPLYTQLFSGNLMVQGILLAIEGNLNHRDQ